MELKKGDRVVVKVSPHVHDIYTGRTGTIIGSADVVGERWGFNGADYHRFYVCLDGHDNTCITLWEDQIGFLILDELARIE